MIDDTRVMGNGPFELLIGREFKLDIWDEMVRSMKVEEVARFVCPFAVSVTYELPLSLRVSVNLGLAPDLVSSN